MSVDTTLLLLLATWIVVIPLLVLFPPKLSALRRRIKEIAQRRVLRSIKMPSLGGLDPKESSSQFLGKITLKKRIVLAFVNSRSGGQLGCDVKNFLISALGAKQVFDLHDTTPESVLQRFSPSSCALIRLLVCGGDGTVGWVMSAAVSAQRPCPIGILPLGTGNDLARALRWGSGSSSITRELIEESLLRLCRSQTLLLDRWIIKIFKNTIDGGAMLEKTMFMNNYLSCGIDAEIALKFHEERQLHPERFTSQAKNLVKYAMYGLEGAFEGLPLNNSVEIHSLKQRSHSIDVNPLWKGIIVNNLPVYHGGKDFWGSSSDLPTGEGSPSSPAARPVSISDQMLEVMAVAGTLHIGLVHLSIDCAIRLAQLDGLRILVHEPTCFQCDGEPWKQEGGTFLEVSYQGAYPVLDGDVPEERYFSD